MTPDSTVPSDTDRLAEIRRRIKAATETEGRSIGAIQNGKKELRQNAAADLTYLLDENATLQGRLDTAEGQLATVGRIIEPRDPNWKPLSERYPEHFKRVTDEERARRNGWDEGVSLMSQRIKAVLDGKSTEDYDGVIACTGCGKCSYCRKRGVTAADVLGLGEGDGQ